MKRRAARLTARWPTLTPLAALVAGMLIVVGVSLLWPPAVWIFATGFWGFVLIDAARRDTKARKR